MARDVPMQNSPSVMCDDEETIENAECERRHREEVHRGDSFPMIAQKCHPSFGRLRVSLRSPHPAQDGSLRDIEAKHLQLTVNAWSTQVGFSATMRKMSSRNSTLTRLPLGQDLRRESHVQCALNPVRCQLTTVSGWTRINACFPSLPESSKHHPVQPVMNCKSRLRIPLPQDCKLLPKRQIFQK
jgi:hypothetical protein